MLITMMPEENKSMLWNAFDLLRYKSNYIVEVAIGYKRVRQKLMTNWGPAYLLPVGLFSGLSYPTFEAANSNSQTATLYE